MMKKCIVAVVMAVCLLIPGAMAADQEALSLSDLNSEETFAFEVERVHRLTPEAGTDGAHYTVQQGCTTDGEYAYFILENQIIDKGSIWKLNPEDWSLVDFALDLPIDHGNDMTYNSKTHQLVIVNNRPNYDTLTIVDPDTLEILDTMKLPYSMYAIDYCESRDQYVVGLSNGYDFIILDGNFEAVDRFSGLDTGLVRQGVNCDDQYIYFPQSREDTDPNAVIVYDWEGNFVSRIRIKSNYQELEGMFQLDGKVYLAFFAGGAHIYEAALVKE